MLGLQEGGKGGDEHHHIMANHLANKTTDTELQPGASSDGEGQAVYIEGEHAVDVSHPRDHLGQEGKGFG